MVDAGWFRWEKKPSESSGKIRKAGIILGIIVLFCFALYHVGSLYLEYIQIQEIGEQYTSVFTKNLITKVVVRCISFIFVFAVSFVSLLFIRRNFFLESFDRGILESKKITIIISALIAFVATTIVDEELSNRFLLFANSQQFGKADPVFGKDIGYYVFQRPFLDYLVKALLAIWFFISVGIFASYWILGSSLNDKSLKELAGIRSVAIHNFVNLCVLLLLACLFYYFKAEGILFESFAGLKGAGYTDKTVWLNYYRIAPVLMILILIFSVMFFKKEKYKALLKTVLVFPLVWVLTLVVALIVQGVTVAPNEVIREEENILANIEFTQAAYGIDDVSEVVFDIQNDLSGETIDSHAEITDNIRIIDLNANLTVLNQIQGIRNYYKFNETDIVPYVVDGKKTAVAITPREITKENLNGNSGTYLNRKLRYTHGFGVVMNPINKVSAQGQPEFLIKDIPPKSETDIPEVKQPRIYYGELTDDYVIVGNDKYKELDYSEGQEDVEFSYDGTGGLELNWWNRLLFSVKYGDARLIFTDMVSDNSRLMINRDVISRLKLVAPFLTYDNDPYMIIDGEGKLKWVVDAYTTTSMYPYSQNYAGSNFNYIRNSVKAVVDAYNGDVVFYIADHSDPIVKAYAAMYPGLFSKEDLPDDIKAHVKFPEYMFKIQSDMYGKYHMSSPSTFYNKNDMWVVAQERYGNSSEPKPIAAYYNMMKLEGEEEEELLLTVPFTLTNKNNMVSWFAVRNEWDNYGKLQIYKFPKGISVSGPMQIENRINSDMDISKELNLWSQGGSQVIRGNMIVVPIENSILYVEPIYIASSNNSALPELKQIVVAYDEKIVMANSLQEALEQLFPRQQSPSSDGAGEENDGPGQEQTDASNGNEGENVTFDEAAKAVVDAFENAKKASAEGDWNEFGKSMDDMETAVEELKKYIQE